MHVSRQKGKKMIFFHNVSQQRTRPWLVICNVTDRHTLMVIPLMSESFISTSGKENGGNIHSLHSNIRELKIGHQINSSFINAT